MKHLCWCLAFALAAQTEWDQFLQQTEALYIKGDFKGALAAAESSLKLAATPAQRSRSLDRTGFLLHQSGRLKEAEAPLREALKLRQEAGAESTAYADTALNLAMLLRDSRRHEEALTLAEQGAALRLRLLGKTPAYAEALNILGTVQYLAARYALGEASYDEALRIHEAALDPDNPTEEYGTLCANFAGSLQRTGNYAKAKVLFDKALASLAKRPGRGHAAYSITLSASAFLEQDLGNFEVADQRYTESLALMLEQMGEAHPAVAIAFNNQGVFYLHLGDLAAAERAFERSLAIRRKIGEPVGLALTLRNYGGVIARRDPEAGFRLFQEAVERMEKAPARPPFEYGHALLTLARSQRDRGLLPQARTHFNRALEIFEKALGPRSPYAGQTWHHLGILEEREGHLPEAESAIRRSLEITRAARGAQHPQLVPTLAVMARLSQRQGRPAEALELYREALRVQNRTQSQLLGLGSESAKAAMLGEAADLAPALIAFANTSTGATQAAARTLAFEAITNQKGRTLDFMRDWQTQLRRHPGLAEWRQVLDCEAALTIAIGYRDWQRPPAGGCALEGTPLAGRYASLAHQIRQGWTEQRAAAVVEALAELRRRAEELESLLSRDVPAVARASQATVESVRAQLAPDEALLEIAAFTEGGAQKYGAFLLDASGTLTWAELGPAAAVDQAVRDLLQSAADWSQAAAAGQTRAASALQATASQVIARLATPFAPLFEARPTLRRLRIAPDGMLQLVPFEALPLAGRPLLERFALAYVQSGRDLTQLPTPAEGLAPPVIAISPGAGAARPAAAAALGFRAGELERLAGALPEARQLQALLRDARVLGEGQATEAALKNIARPRLLHLIGHGVVRGKEDCSPCELNALKPAARVMNLSAIVLEEAYGRGGSSTQDGLLTAQELRSLDLQGTEMLVLSQCRMADGVPATGDGVHGMRRAVAFSGARSFVAPLWKVADRHQQLLMARFYTELTAGTSRAEALRRAKLALARQPASRHFLHWAAPLLFGEAGPLAPGTWSPAASGHR